MPLLKQVSLSAGTVATIPVPTDMVAAWVSNASPFDLAVSFDASPAAPAPANFTDFQFSPQWVEVVPARRARTISVPAAAQYRTPQGATLAPGSGRISLFPWPDANLNTFNGPCGEARVVAYSAGETPSRDDGSAIRFDGTAQERMLAVLPAAWHSFSGLHQFTAAAQSITLGDVGLPFGPRLWDGTTVVIAYIYNALLFTDSGGTFNGRLQIAELGGSGSTYDILNIWLPASGRLEFTPSHPYAARITPSNGTTLLSLKIQEDGVSAPVFLFYNLAVDVDARNGLPVPAIGYGELAGDSGGGNARAAGFW